MSSRIQMLKDKDLIRPPKWLPKNIMYECIMGSVAYGVSSDNSDVDVYGFCIPPKEDIFPHLTGHIPGFGRKPKPFGVFQKHHVIDKDDGKEYDFNIYGIVRYFQLCMDNNPNMIDSLFVPLRCVLHASAVGQMVRENRKIFLHKGCFKRLKGYAYGELHKLNSKKTEGKRKESIEKFGYNVKSAYHIVRLIDECEMILTEGDLDITRSREKLKAIRRGEWTEQRVRDYFELKEKHLEDLFHSSKAIPQFPDEDKIKQLLLDCLEEHYGNLEKCVVQPNKAIQALKEMREVMDKYGDLI